MQTPKFDEPNPGSRPIAFNEYVFTLFDGGMAVPFSIAFSMSLTWRTFPTRPKYFRLYSLSNEGDALAAFISSSVYILPTP
jgi:hypothetical protein